MRSQGPSLWCFATSALLGLCSGEAWGQTTGYFGPEQALEIQPEVKVYYHVSDDFRLLAQVQSTLIPADSYSEISIGAFADWLIARDLRKLLSPDLAKTHTLELQGGALYTTTIDPGTLKSSENVILQGQVTPRYFLPWDVLIVLRNRAEAQWALENGDKFSFIYSGRLQLEREFAIGTSPLTPFVNAQLTWTSPPAMWTQFRMEAGLQCGFHWFGRGQIIEANFSVETKLQPSHSWTPVVGLIWYIYF